MLRCPCASAKQSLSSCTRCRTELHLATLPAALGCRLVTLSDSNTLLEKILVSVCCEAVPSESRDEFLRRLACCSAFCRSISAPHGRSSKEIAWARSQV